MLKSGYYPAFFIISTYCKIFKQILEKIEGINILLANKLEM